MNVRVLGASNASLRNLVSAGTFRPDLLYRLSVLTIELAPLREREGDIELLTTHFLHRAAGEYERPLRITREALDSLVRYPFPGNVRELENAIRSAVALCSNEIITLDCLPGDIVSRAGEGHPTSVADVERALVADRPTMGELQKRYLQLVLDENGGNRRRAAVALGLDRRTVQRLIARYQLRAQEDSAEPDSGPIDDAQDHAGE